MWCTVVSEWHLAIVRTDWELSSESPASRHRFPASPGRGKPLAKWQATSPTYIAIRLVTDFAGKSPPRARNVDARRPEWVPPSGGHWLAPLSHLFLPRALCPLASSRKPRKSLILASPATQVKSRWACRSLSHQLICISSLLTSSRPCFAFLSAGRWQMR